MRIGTIDAASYAETERRLAALLGTTRDVVILQGEAILALEAIALGLGGEGVRALSLVSGPYGEVIGRWLRRGGAEVTEVACGFDRALDPAVVGRALSEGRFDVVAVVHAEAATGAVNPLAEIAALAHSAGAVVFVDAVASVGADPLAIDEWGLDLVAIGTQKALSGPNGVCAIVAGQRGWEAIERNGSAPRGSALSLLDVRDAWLGSGRARLPFYVSDHEMHALQAALSERLEEGIDACVARHARARAATRAGLRALGLAPWIAADSEASAVATLVAAPDGVPPARLLSICASPGSVVAPGLLTAAPGPLGEQALRINHMGAAARLGPVLEVLAGLASGLQRLGFAPDAAVALGAAAAAFS
jgi:aspartate aminotransferase-like enzyme